MKLYAQFSMRSKVSFVILLIACLCFSLSAASQIFTVGSSSNNVTVLSSNDNGCVIEVGVGSFKSTEVDINGTDYNLLKLSNGTQMKEKGCPALPKIARSIAIPHGKDITYKVLEKEYTEYKMKVAPSKGIISRSVNPDDVAYVFNGIYKSNANFPENLVEIGTPYLIRQVRGVTVTVFPFSYNPYTETVRVYTKLKIEVVFDGTNRTNSIESAQYKSNKFFEPIMKNHFINYSRAIEQTRLVGEDGEMLIICHGDFMDEMAPFVTHKTNVGLTTVLVNMVDVGTTAADVTTYIQNYYDDNPTLSFVLLVGDYDQIPSELTGGTWGGGQDPLYSLVSGADEYPDIIIGRFSAETEDEVTTMVDRSIFYENMSQENWLHQGAGIASSEGTGDDDEYDYEHLRNIRTDLLNWHYTSVDELYEGDQGGDDQPGTPSVNLISGNINNGRSIINFTGHGSETSWGWFDPGWVDVFSSTDVDALTNDNKLPFIFSVACVVGNFTSYTCFAESWLRATNSGTDQPTGAIGFYGSTINQSWAPPMQAQDAFNLLLTTEANSTFGALCYNASISMIDEYGVAGVNMFNTWHIFGDPSIVVIPDPAPTEEIRVQYMTYAASAWSNHPSVNIRIYNDGATDIDLSRVSAEYYYTYEGFPQTEIANVYYAGILPAGTYIGPNVNASITSPGGDARTLTVTFDGGTGTLAPGEYVECQMRFNKGNWGPYYQTNDYSFGMITSFQDWNQIIAFIDGTPVWGTAP